jgi:UDP-N-acetylmuramoyl-L-alanyl-D-glutamate--2,6-diaminopimelate ligase
MKLKGLDEVLVGVPFKRFGDEDVQAISHVEIDSRKIKENGLFIALEGTKVDGHSYINSAIENGASVVVCHQLPDKMQRDVAYFQVDNSGKYLGLIASNFWGDPSKKLNLLGVTGTNGKTTIATLLYELLGKLGIKTGLLSTIENKIAGRVIKSTHTTPDLLVTNQLMAEMLEEGCEFVVMEVSSHAIDQGRIDGLDFDGAIFTNLTNDHLDYHGSFKDYVYTKKKFFDNLKPEAFALVNVDDRNGAVMLQNCSARHRSYALKQMADYKALILQNSLHGLHMKINGKETFFKLIGSFNAYNLLAVYGAVQEMGFDDEKVRVALSGLEPARGRFEIVYNEKLEVMAIIDYAHTADALENVLKTIDELKSPASQVITLAGAGGDRDRSKRPVMGAVAARWSDTVILTSDNPRSEDPTSIVEEMLGGVDEDLMHKVLKVIDRKEAIRVATKLASKGDVILIAGKGHETYQVIGDETFPFDDKEILKNIWF